MTGAADTYFRVDDTRRGAPFRVLEVSLGLQTVICSCGSEQKANLIVGALNKQLQLEEEQRA